MHQLGDRPRPINCPSRLAPPMGDSGRTEEDERRAMQLLVSSAWHRHTAKKRDNVSLTTTAGFF
jgi:hypothetical protein